MPKGDVYSRHRIVVYEIEEGTWTHTLAKEQWDTRKSALADAMRYRAPGETVGFDIPLALRRRAENMGVDVDAPITKKELSSTGPIPKTFDPFALDRGWEWER